VRLNDLAVGEALPPSMLSVGFLGLIDPITLGGASTGLIGVINHRVSVSMAER